MDSESRSWTGHRAGPGGLRRNCVWVWKIVAVLTALVVLGGCDETTTSPGGFETIAGTYQAPVQGGVPGIEFSGIFTASITQNGGDLAGNWSLVGELISGPEPESVIATGPLVGFIGPGTNPLVEVVLENSACSGYRADFDGRYDAASETLMLSGVVDILQNCQIIVEIPQTFEFVR